MYAYAKTEDMGALEEFMSGQHQANLQSVGDRVFDEGLYEAARAIFAHIPNWGRLASTLVRLHQFQQAVDAARKANSPRTWKEVRALLILSRPHSSYGQSCQMVLFHRRILAHACPKEITNPSECACPDLGCLPTLRVHRHTLLCDTRGCHLHLVCTC